MRRMSPNQTGNNNIIVLILCYEIKWTLYICYRLIEWTLHTNNCVILHNEYVDVMSNEVSLFMNVFWGEKDTNYIFKLQSLGINACTTNEKPEN